ncbi:hypothetical protein FG386_003084 [Cryptosporidium ryanae]|uniref:uncharacterized protein n=1 Tax=Cryptosporidium ryanae TaxID=515981 RepID=UPI00351A98C9|nr:hypothetical protein FG386_003084 [Cryptosporidium ryanae]
MSNKNGKSSKKTSIKIFTLRILWISYFILLLISGLVNLVLYYELKRLVVNIFILFAGLISLLSEFCCFKFYSYMLFIYTPIGRGIFMTTLSCLLLDDNLPSLTTSLVLFINSLLYLIISVLFGGINKPLFNSSLKHELDLTAHVYFINDPGRRNKGHKERKSGVNGQKLLNDHETNKHSGHKNSQALKQTENGHHSSHSHSNHKNQRGETHSLHHGNHNNVN